MDRDSVRNAFRQRWSNLRGDAIDKVFYYEIAYEAGLVGWSIARPRFDTLDFGVEFHLLSGARLSVAWGWELVQYGLTFTNDSLATSLRHFAVHEVSTQPHWAPNLGRRIEKAELLWQESDIEPEHGVYVQTAWLALEGGARIYVTAAECDMNPPRVHTMMDNVLIAFDKDTARSIGILHDD
jgi:hypothetical protein